MNSRGKIMKKKDIKVGQKYTHINYPGVVYLGVGAINRNTNTFSRKNLVIISSHEPWGSVGYVVHAFNPDFWYGFSEMK